MAYVRQTGKKDVVKLKHKSGVFIKLKSGGHQGPFKNVAAAKKRVAQIVYFRDHAK